MRRCWRQPSKPNTSWNTSEKPNSLASTKLLFVSVSVCLLLLCVCAFLLLLVSGLYCNSLLLCFWLFALSVRYCFSPHRQSCFFFVVFTRICLCFCLSLRFNAFCLWMLSVSLPLHLCLCLSLSLCASVCPHPHRVHESDQKRAREGD